MAKTSKKATSTSTFKKWRVVTDTDQTDIEADGVGVDESGVLIFSKKGAIIAAWSLWRSVIQLPPEPPPEPEAAP